MPCRGADRKPRFTFFGGTEWKRGTAASAPRSRSFRGAVALGLIAGTCVGYLIRADREPTALPSLSQPVLRQAGGPAPAPLSAAQDRKVKTDGDLRKLLLQAPGGAKDLGKGAVVIQSRKGGAAAVPFQQTVVLHSQLLT
ncbi:hypothetical protein [Streptomyces sp. NPDC014006]|uniref:hypothetical protein n=1 Tax=Streptomyces sp. NPDC014006 TaxID=3364870 RepID=UPI0037004004